MLLGFYMQFKDDPMKNIQHKQWIDRMKQILQLNRCRQLMISQKTKFPIRHKHEIIEKIHNIVQIFLFIYNSGSNNILSSELNLMIQRLYESIKDAIYEQECFECKVQSYLNLIPIRLIKLTKEALPSQIFNTYLETILVCTKYRKLSEYTWFYISQITKFCISHELLDKYEPFLFEYEFIKNIPAYQILLNSKDSDYKLVYLYMHFYGLQQYDEIYDLINNLLKLLDKYTSNFYSQNFHNQISFIITKLLQIPSETEYIFDKHASIISNFQKNDNCYVGLYFNALILTTIKCPDNKFILKICFSLNNLDWFSRKLILNDLYARFIFWFNLTGKKLKYFIAKQVRYTSKKLSLLDIMKYRCPNKKINLRYRKPIQNKLRKFHQYCENFKLPGVTNSKCF